MKTDKRTAENSWQAIDLLTEETLGWYPNSNAAYIDNPNRPIDTYYRPSRRKTK